MTEEQVKQDVELYNSECQPLKENEIISGYPDCKICGNKRYLAQAGYNEVLCYWYITYSPCKCQNAIRSLSNIADSGLADLITNYKFNNFLIKNDWQKNMRDTAIEFGKSVSGGGRQWLLILGQSGSGKTHICTALCGALFKKGFSVKYFRWGVEGKRVKSIINLPDYAAEFDKIMLNDIIYIDDLFKRKKGAEVTDGDVKLAFELIDTALAERKVLIVSGEDTFAKLQGVDGAIAGRLIQNAGEYIIELFGSEKNQRMQRKE